MKCRLLFTLLCAGWAGFAQAEIYKYVDADGHVTYSSMPRKGAKKLNLDPRPAPSAPSARGAVRNEAGPADFPKVDGSTQRSRDDTRRKILENEMATEEKLLQEARRNLKDEQARSADRADEKTRALREELTLHEKNIDALKTELGSIK